MYFYENTNAVSSEQKSRWTTQHDRAKTLKKQQRRPRTVKQLESYIRQ